MLPDIPYVFIIKKGLPVSRIFVYKTAGTVRIVSNIGKEILEIILSNTESGIEELPLKTEMIFLPKTPFLP